MLIFSHWPARQKDPRGLKTYADIVRAWTEPRNGYGDSYWVDAKIIEDLRKKQLILQLDKYS